MDVLVPRPASSNLVCPTANIARLRIIVNMGAPLIRRKPMVTPGAVPQTVYVSFSAEINAATTESLLATMANSANQGLHHAYLLLSTRGGAIMNGMNLSTGVDSQQLT